MVPLIRSWNRTDLHSYRRIKEKSELWILFLSLDEVIRPRGSENARFPSLNCIAYTAVARLYLVEKGHQVDPAYHRDESWRSKHRDFHLYCYKWHDSQFASDPIAGGRQERTCSPFLSPASSPFPFCSLSFFLSYHRFHRQMRQAVRWAVAAGIRWRRR